MKYVKIKSWLISVSLLMIAAASLVAQHTLADLKNFESDKIYVKGFTVKRVSVISIDAVGVMARSHKWNRWNPMIAYGWILNTDTHEVVWAMTQENVSKAQGTNNVKFEGTLSLEPGHYEAYFSTYGQKIIKISRSGSYLGEFLRNLTKVFIEDEDLYEDAHQWHLKIATKDEDNFASYDGSKSKAVFVDLTGARDSDFLEKGFSVDKDIKVKIYCNGEGQDSRMYDFGWLMDDKSGRQVWEMRYENTSNGGGAEKNRTYTGIVSLTAGNYVATYVTDDSHSFNEWNMQPPYDPANWGLMLSVLDENDLAYIRDYKKAKRQEILAITKVGDNQFRTEGFSLSKTTDILIYALGEGRDNRMYDYGWITDANSGSTVWEMRYNETKFAGGTDKNRLYEGAITLQPGSYMVNYRTDGSHSYNDWNDAPPYNQNKWGITLSLANNDEVKNISKYTESDDRSVLAQIVRVGDDEYRTQPFTLDKNTKVRILCIGEGKNGRMYDFGWIKNAETGQTVWEMTYAMTAHAGGGKKNRVFDGTLSLEAGRYEATYISDGSHSFDDWNDDPPNQPDKWGITIKLAK
jgi:hypothetical protein